MFGSSHLKTIKEPFYTYSMREAIRDGLVLDVTQHYSTVAVLAKISQTPSNTNTGSVISLSPPSVNLLNALSEGEVNAPTSSSDTPTEKPVNLDTLFRDGRKAAYHVLRVPGQDMVFA